ncbi:MAG: acyl-CoA dehydrogenase family protein, partial [Alphaproteobacteria bacterium]
GSAVDVAVLTEAFGAGLTLEPYIASVMLGGKLVEALGNEAQKSEILPALAEGRLKLALAHNEPNARFNLSHVETVASPAGDGYLLDGRKSVVLHAASADKILIVARLTGDAGDADGLGVFIVDNDTSGMMRQDYATVDSGRASDISLSQVEVTKRALLGGNADALPALQNVVDGAISAVCAEAVGAMNKVLDITKEYTAVRTQFGKAIGDNQVIQHFLVDMFTAAEEAKALTDMTTMRLAEGAENASLLVSAMKAKVGEAARFVGAKGVQLHGGIGMTDEYTIGHYFKRLMAIDMMFGDSRFHLNRFADAI